MLIVKRDQNVYKTATKSALIHTKQILLSSNRIKLISPWSFTHVLKKIETTMRRNCISKAHFRISIHKNLIPKHLDNALTDFALTSRTLEEKASANNFGRRVPSAEKYGCWKNWKQLHDNLRKAQRITRDHQSVYYIKENLLYIHR